MHFGSWIVGRPGDARGLLPRSALASGLGVLALAATQAGAQTAAPPPPTPADTSPAVADAADVAAPGSDAGDIVVTAQRRSERLRDVPISITALNSEMLVKSGVNNTLDIARITPGLQLPLYGGFLQPSIRGINSAGAGLGDSSNVAVYVDGVYQPSESAQLMDLPDVQQIEVLKGPQGTLYGQNAAGGAITVTTVAPSFIPAGRISASYGRYDDKSLRAYVTGPISETIAVSVAGAYEDRDGFRRDILRGGRGAGLESRLIRGRLLYQPTDDLSFTLSGYYTRRADGDVYAGKAVGPGTALGDGLAGAYGIPVTEAGSPHETATNVIPLAEFTTYGVNLLGRFTTGLGTFSTVTAYGNVKVRDTVDADYGSVNIADLDLRIDHHDFIQELNFVSDKTGPLSVSAGLFYLALTESYVPQIFNGYFAAFGDPLTVYPARPAPLFQAGTSAFLRKRSYAAYVELAYDITERLNVSAAGRYSYETQRVGNNDIFSPPIPDLRGQFHFSKFTPRATLRYKLGDRSNVYATYSQGFKSGYVDPSNAVITPGQVTNPPTSPEVVYAYEVGYKGRLFDRLSLNFAAFHYDYKNLQVFVSTPPTGFYQNAASARINGLDLDVTLPLGRDLSLSAGASYTDAKYRSFRQAGVYRPNPLGFGYDLVSLDVSGNRLPRTPKYTANVAANYGLDTGAGRFSAYGSVFYNSGISYDPAGFVRQGRYTTVNGELSFAPDAVKGLRLVLWGKNLTDKSYLSSVLETNFVYGGSYAEPRTYGVRAEFQF